MADDVDALPATLAAPGAVGEPGELPPAVRAERDRCERIAKYFGCHSAVYLIHAGKEVPG